MENRFRVLAEMFSEMRYFDLNEVESLIKIHFNSWYSDELKNEFENDIVKKRDALVMEMSNMQISRCVIESHLLIAKSELREGKEVDTVWMAKANLAYRIKGRQIVDMQAKLCKLKAKEKASNIEKANSESRLLKEEYFKYHKDLYGEEEAREIQARLLLKLGIERVENN